MSFQPDEAADQLADRPLTVPAVSRLPLDRPDRTGILTAHEAALAAGELGYPEPQSGLFVLTARFLADRGYCCGRGCRHCPYVEDTCRLATGHAARVVTARALAPR